jgi:hypothetical protein
VLEKADLLLHRPLTILQKLEPVGSERLEDLILVRHDPTPTATYIDAAGARFHPDADEPFAKQLDGGMDLIDVSGRPAEVAAPDVLYKPIRGTRARSSSTPIRRYYLVSITWAGGTPRRRSYSSSNSASNQGLHRDRPPNDTPYSAWNMQILAGIS